MKKLVLMLAVAFSVSLFSCGNGDKKDVKDSCDSCCNKDSVEAPAAQNADSLTQEADSLTQNPDSVVNA